MPKTKDPAPTNKLFHFKELNGLTWTEFAKRIGVTRRTLRRIVHGDISDLKISTIEKIHEVTGLALDDYYPRNR